jgi:hypothetical protein
MRTTLWNPNSNNNVYRVEDDKVRCLNCSDDKKKNDDEIRKKETNKDY